MKQELVLQQVQKLKASEILRQTKLEQTICRCRRENKYCAIGAIAMGLGWDGENDYDAYNMVRKLVEYYEDIITGIYRRNDGTFFPQHSFSDIADWLETRGL